jgi:hypothetical protein
MWKSVQQFLTLMRQYFWTLGYIMSSIELVASIWSSFRCRGQTLSTQSIWRTIFGAITWNRYYETFLYRPKAFYLYKVSRQSVKHAATMTALLVIANFVQSKIFCSFTNWFEMIFFYPNVFDRKILCFRLWNFVKLLGNKYQYFLSLIFQKIDLIANITDSFGVG